MSIRVGILLFQLLCNRTHGLLCPVQRYLRFQAAYNIEPSGSPVCSFLFCKCQRYPDVGSPHQREMELFRHHSNHGIALAIQQNGLATEIWVTIEPLMPEPIADDCYLPVSLLVFFRPEISADGRGKLQCAEKICAYSGSGNSLGHIHSR